MFIELADLGQQSPLAAQAAALEAAASAMPPGSAAPLMQSAQILRAAIGQDPRALNMQALALETQANTMDANAPGSGDPIRAAASQLRSIAQAAGGDTPPPAVASSGLFGIPWIFVGLGVGVVTIGVGAMMLGGQQVPARA